ncbi:DUF4435 domain-containing protein [Pseudodesulfovibrio sp.]|uniref:DUF4435 domain-containing protein n=1 Tax=unclassified Pseudodesulfovibrio TaxID=2661612 RepID=UPI003B008E62
MTSYTNFMKSDKLKIQGIYQKYKIRVKSRKQIFAFYEGFEDSSFYGNFIERKVRGEVLIETIVCKGKKYVIGIYELLKKRAELSSLQLFFVDKDLDPYVNNEYFLPGDIFETKYYSFENYVFTADMLKKVLVDYFAVEHCDIPTLIEKYNSEFSRFVKGVRPIIGLAISSRKRGLKFIFNDMNINNFFSINDDLCLIRRRGRKKEILRALEKNEFEGEAPFVPVAVIHQMTSQLANEDHRNYIRGKYEKWFWVNFYTRIPNFLKRCSKKCRESVHLNGGDCTRILAPKVVTCLELEKYLRVRLAA